MSNASALRSVKKNHACYLIGHVLLHLSQRAINGIDEDFSLSSGPFLVAGVLGCLKKVLWCSRETAENSENLMHVVLGW